MARERDSDQNRRLVSAIQTSFTKSQSPESSGPGSSSPAIASPKSPSPQISRSQHQRIVLADPVALGYLEGDPSAKVLERTRVLEGYQCYLIEQWACSRTHPTFVITTYTGDTAHTITVGVLSVPADESTWSVRLKVYFKALAQYHARRKETVLGTLMITNLNGFPSSLTVITVPSGDLRKSREDFFVNENLKRLGCSGRVGISLNTPTLATQAKFHQLYKTSDLVPLYSSVIELVKLCQVALMLFGKLEPEYADGLLCDITEKAVTEWWINIGTDLYNIEPSDGILGPSTVAALLGTLMGARNRLQAFGAPVAKDVFDIEPTKRGIAYFQKSNRMSKTRRLDRQTIERLHRATDKQASGESWLVPRAVKSTVAELSGKGGEMVMEMVGGKDKAGIAEVETVDIETLVQLISGERAKWLWHGKPRKRTTRDLFSEALPGDDGLVFQENEENEFAWAGQRKDSTFEPLKPRATMSGSFRGKHANENRAAGESGDVDPLLRKTVLKRATGRLRDAVGIKGHRKEDEFGGPLYAQENNSDTTLQSSYTGPTAGLMIARTSGEVVRDSPADSIPLSAAADLEALPSFTKAITETPDDQKTSFIPSSPVEVAEKQPELDSLAQETTNHSGSTTVDPSIAGSALHDTDLENLLLPVDSRPGQPVTTSLRRTYSCSKFESDIMESRNYYYWPRNLSFSAAESAILDWPPLLATIRPKDADTPRPSNPTFNLQRELQNAETARHLRARIASVGTLIGAWMQARVAMVDNLDTLAARDIEQLSSIYYPRKADCATLEDSQLHILSEERSGLLDATRDVEALGGKLEYEVNALKGKVEEVEAAVEEFERGLVYSEGRCRELVGGESREGWLKWIMRVMLRSHSGNRDDGKDA